MDPGASRDTAAPRGEAGHRPLAPRRASLRLNAFAWTFSNLVHFSVIFLVTPIAMRHLGADGWGIWQLVGATAIYAQLLNMSLGTATHYQVAYRSARGDWAGLATVFTNVRLYLLGAGLLLVAALVLAGRPFVEALMPPEQGELAWSALLIAIVIASVDLQTRAGRLRPDRAPAQRPLRRPRAPWCSSSAWCSASAPA